MCFYLLPPETKKVSYKDRNFIITSYWWKHTSSNSSEKSEIPMINNIKSKPLRKPHAAKFNFFYLYKQCLRIEMCTQERKRQQIGIYIFSEWVVKTELKIELLVLFHIFGSSRYGRQAGRQAAMKKGSHSKLLTTITRIQIMYTNWHIPHIKHIKPK